MFLVHGQDSVIVVVGLAGHGKVKALIALFFCQIFISKSIFSVGTADIADLNIVVRRIHIMEFVGIAVRLFHDLQVAVVQEQEQRESGEGYGEAF